MTVSFTNNWKNILDELRSVLRTEFGGSIPVFIGDGDAGTQFIRLEPKGSDLIDYMVTSETREFTVNMFYVFSGANVKKDALDHILRIVSRVEALIHDNISMTLTDSTRAFNCRLESTELNSDEEEGIYMVSWVYKCIHTSNIS
jgi:hypothetical protein